MRRSSAHRVVERYNTGAGCADLDAESRPVEPVWTYGLNFNLNLHVVFKADYQHFAEDGDRNRVDLGLGLMF
jgi:hypothetical protein